MSDAEIEDVLGRDISAALGVGRVSALRSGDWPRYAWGRSSFRTTSKEVPVIEVVWEAEVTNAGLGEYKAYPIQKERHSNHMPPAVKRALWP